MHTLLAAAALAASLAGPHNGPCNHNGCSRPGFAPAIHNRLLVTAPPEDVTRVYTPGYSSNRARLWVGEDVKDIAARRAWRENPGKVAYGAADAGHDRVQVRVNNQKVSISAWQQVDGEGWANLERGRQQWLKERGYTGGVRTFVHPSRLRDMQNGNAASVAESKAAPEPSATIQLRKPRETGGKLKQVDAGVAGGVKIVSGNKPVRVSYPMTVKASTVERSVAKGWTEDSDATTRTANADK